jgi:hypothetical protein
VARSKGGQVIVTSRLADFGGNFDPLELDVAAGDSGGAWCDAKGGCREMVADY